MVQLLDAMCHFDCCARVPFLVGKLRSHKLRDAAKWLKKRKVGGGVFSLYRLLVAGESQKTKFRQER